MTNPKWEEQIIAVPTEKLFEEVERFQGVVSDKEKMNLLNKAIEENFIVMRRGNTADPTPKEQNAEINTNYKQPIPYVVLRQKDKVFCYERLQGGGESRLHNMISIGVGGHMNRDYDTFKACLNINTKRELNEELNIETNGGTMVLNTIGILNDDSNEVSNVHIGLLLEMILSEDVQVSVRETDQLKGFWSTPQELKEKHYEQLESWSQIAVDNLV